MANESINPLGPQHCTTLDCILQRAVQLQEFANKCKDCGFDVSAAQDELTRQVNQATAIKKNFFPLNH